MIRIVLRPTAHEFLAFRQFLRGDSEQGSLIGVADAGDEDEFNDFGLDPARLWAMRDWKDRFGYLKRR